MLNLDEKNDVETKSTGHRKVKTNEEDKMTWQKRKRKLFSSQHSYNNNVIKSNKKSNHNF